jgi:hypothetical protein
MDPERNLDASSDPSIINEDTLRAYLADTLPPGVQARVEKALRASAELRAQLEDVRQNRGVAGLHTLGAIWRRARLTCPTRQQLGSALLDALDPELAAYISFHLDVIECPFCQANLADLKAKTAQPSPATQQRRNRILKSSQHLLGDDGRA